MAGSGLLGKKRPDADADQTDDRDDLEPQADDQSPDGEEPAPEDTSENGDGQPTYDQFVKNALTVMFDKKTLPTLLQSIAAGGVKPVVGLARTIALLISRVAGSAQQAGTEIPDDVIQHGAVELCAHLADLAAEAGLHKYTPPEIQTAALLAVKLYAQMSQGPQPPGAGAQQQAPPQGAPEDQMADQQQPGTGLAAAA